MPNSLIPRDMLGKFVSFVAAVFPTPGDVSQLIFSCALPFEPVLSSSCPTKQKHVTNV